MMQKIKTSRGETLLEVLVALVIVVLCITMLSRSIFTASSINNTSNSGTNTVTIMAGAGSGSGSSGTDTADDKDNGLVISDCVYTYDGNAHGSDVRVTGRKDGVAVSVSNIQYRYSASDEWSNAAPTRTYVGSTTVEVQATVSGSGDTLTGSYTLTVNQLGVTITSGSATLAPGETCHSYTVSPNNLPDALTITFSDKTYNSGTHQNEFTYTIAHADCYDITPVYGNLTFRQEDSMEGLVTASDQKYPYNGSYQGAGVTLDSSISGAAVYYTSGGKTTVNECPTFCEKGTYTVKYTVVLSGYKEYTGSYTVEIFASPYTLEINGLPANGYTYDSWVHGGDVSAVLKKESEEVNRGLYTISYDGASSAPTRQNAGSQQVSVTAVMDGVTVATTTYTLKVNPAKVTISAVVNGESSHTSTYGDAVSFGFDTDAQIADDIHCTFLCNSTEYGDESVDSLNAGSYSVTINEDSVTCDNENYEVEISETPASLTVNRKGITVKASDATKVYGQTDPAFSYEVTGLLARDKDTANIACTVSRSDTSNNVSGSPYTLDITGTEEQGNYKITAFNSGELTITPKPITLTPSVNFASVESGQSVVFSATCGADDLVGTDTLADVGYLFHCECSADSHDYPAGTNTVNLQEGTYTVSCIQNTAVASNYTISSGTTQLAVTFSREYSVVVKRNSDTVSDGGTVSYTYDGNAKGSDITATAMVSINDAAPVIATDVTVKYSTDNSTWSTTKPTITNANADGQTVYVGVFGASGNKLASQSYKLVVGTASATLNITLNNTTITYGETVTATVEPSVSSLAGKINYTLKCDGNTVTSGQPVSGLNAGTHTFTVTINSCSDPNYTVTAGSGKTVTVNAKVVNVTLSVSPAQARFRDNVTFSVTLSDTAAESYVTYGNVSCNNKSFVVGTPTSIKRGFKAGQSYPATLQNVAVSGTNNYVIGTVGTCSLEILTVSYTMTVSNNAPMTYNGEAQGGNVSVTVTGKQGTDNNVDIDGIGVELKYKTTKNQEWSSIKPTVTNVSDSTTVTVGAFIGDDKVAEKTYDLTVKAKELTLSMNKTTIKQGKKVIFTVPSADVYGTDNPGIKVKFSGPETHTYDMTSSTLETAIDLNPGDYTITASCTNTNYTIKSGSLKLTITKGKKAAQEAINKAIEQYRTEIGAYTSATPYFDGNNGVFDSVNWYESGSNTLLSSDNTYMYYYDRDSWKVTWTESGYRWYRVSTTALYEAFGVTSGNNKLSRIKTGGTYYTAINKKISQYISDANNFASTKDETVTYVYDEITVNVTLKGVNSGSAYYIDAVFSVDADYEVEDVTVRYQLNSTEQKGGSITETKSVTMQKSTNYCYQYKNTSWSDSNTTNRNIDFIAYVKNNKTLYKVYFTQIS